MRRYLHFLVALVLSACASNPYTGRSQLLLLSESEEIQLGGQAYQEALAGEEHRTFDPVYTSVVERIGRRLAAEIEKGWGEIPPPRYQWEFNVIDDPDTVNAWCLPGGKIAVYTGIFTWCKNDDGLAIVIGHEIFHAILHHSNERISQGLMASIGTEVLSTAVGGEDEEKKKQIHGLLGLGAQVGVLLPYSREGESESDQYGLYLAAKAGYNPRAGIDVWTRALEMSGGGGQPPEFLSTHPAHQSRIDTMQEWMPQALQYYEASQKQPSNPLPAPGGSRRVGPAHVPYIGVTGGSARRETTEGIAGASFPFRTDAAVYLERVEIRGAVEGTLEIGTGIPAGVDREVQIRRPKEGDPAFPSGTYEIRFLGKATGIPWSQKATYVLQ